MDEIIVNINVIENENNKWNVVYEYNKNLKSNIYMKIHYFDKVDKVDKFTHFIVNDKLKLRNSFESKYITLPLIADSHYNFVNVKNVHCMLNQKFVSSISANIFTQDNPLYNVSVSRLLGYELVLEIENLDKDVYCVSCFYKNDIYQKYKSEKHETSNAIYESGMSTFIN